jgi:hypothetical protein
MEADGFKENPVAKHARDTVIGAGFAGMGQQEECVVIAS